MNPAGAVLPVSGSTQEAARTRTIYMFPIVLQYSAYRDLCSFTVYSVINYIAQEISLLIEQKVKSHVSDATTDKASGLSAYCRALLRFLNDVCPQTMKTSRKLSLESLFLHQIATGGHLL